MPPLGAQNTTVPWEDRKVFFIYDRVELQKSGSSPEDGLLFFFPNTVTIEDRYSLVGQLVGMVSFTEGVLGMGPQSIKLKNGKFVVKCLRNFIMVLGGAISDPDNLLVEQLAYLYGIFTFFHNSFEAVLKIEQTLDNMKRKMFEIWNCYLPLVRHYGEDLLSCFNAIQYTELEDTSCNIYLKALQILEACQRRPDSLCGCIFSEEKLIVSQVHPDLLRYLSFFKPGQIHLPNSGIAVEGDLPHGVRIFEVYINEKSYQEIKCAAKLTPYSLLKKTENLSSESLESGSVRIKDKLEDVAMDGIALMEPVQLRQEDKPLLTQKKLGEDKDNLLPLQEDKRYFSIVRSISMADSASLTSLEDSFVDVLSSNLSNCEEPIENSYPKETLPSSNDSDIDLVWDKQYGGELEDLRESVRRFNMCYDHTPNSTVTHENPPGLHSNFSQPLPDVENYSINSSLLKSLSSEIESATSIHDNKVPASSNLPNETNQEVLRSKLSLDDNHPSLESKASIICNVSSTKSQNTETLFAIKNEHESNYSPISERNQKELTECDTSSLLVGPKIPLYRQEKNELCDAQVKHSYLDRSQNFTHSASSNELGDKIGIIPKITFSFSTKNVTTQSSEINFDCQSTNALDSESLKRDHNDLSSQLTPEEKSIIDITYRKTIERSEDCHPVEEHLITKKGNNLNPDEENHQEMKTLHLYVQSHSNTIILIFLDPKSNHDAQMLRSIYEIVVPQLGDLEATIQNSGNSYQEPNKNDEFVYFMYDNDEKKYRGGCPFISQEDYVFAGAIKSIHSQFKHSSTMFDATYRDYNKAVYGKRTLHQETYYQPRGTYKAIQGAPTPYDVSCVIDRRINGRLKKGTGGIVL